MPTGKLAERRSSTAFGGAAGGCELDDRASSVPRPVVGSGGARRMEPSGACQVGIGSVTGGSKPLLLVAGGKGGGGGGCPAGAGGPGGNGCGTVPPGGACGSGCPTAPGPGNAGGLIPLTAGGGTAGKPAAGGGQGGRWHLCAHPPIPASANRPNNNRTAFCARMVNSAVIATIRF